MKYDSSANRWDVLRVSYITINSELWIRIMGVSTENAQLQKEKPGTFGDRLGVLKKEDHPKDQHLAITGLLETAPFISIYTLW